MTAPDTSPRPPDKRPASPTARQSDHPAAADDFVPVYFDPVFKRVFADPADLRFLRSLLEAVLGWPADQLADLTVVDPHLGRTHHRDKQSVLDVRVRTAAKDDIDIEIQLIHVPGFENRIVYYTAGMLYSQLGPSQEYDQLNRTVSVAITNFRLVNDDDYHHRFRLHDSAHQIDFTNVLQVDLLELPKLPPQDDGTLLWSWLNFIKAGKKEEMTMAATASPLIAEAATKAAAFTQEEIDRYFELQEIKANRDRLAIERGLREEGARKNQLKIARRMIAKGLPIDTVAEFTELTPDEVAALG